MTDPRLDDLGRRIDAAIERHGLEYEIALRRIGRAFDRMTLAMDEMTASLQAFASSLQRIAKP